MWFLLGPGLSLRRLWKMCSFTLCSHLKGTEVFENKYPLIYTQDKKEQRENKSSDGLKRTFVLSWEERFAMEVAIKCELDQVKR